MNTTSLSKIFDIVYGNQLDLNKLEIDLENGINFISRSRENLGLQTKVKKIKNKTLFKKGSITVTLGGSYLLSSFVQGEDFYTAQNIKVLTPKQYLTDLQKKFYCYLIEHNRFRYTSHGREANKTLNNLLVPTIDSIPNWINTVKIITPIKQGLINKKSKLDVDNWKYFNLVEYFKMSAGKYYPSDSYKKGGTPLITASNKNNGVKSWTNLKGIFQKGALTIGKIGASAHYQSIDFIASSDVTVLVPKNKNYNIFYGLFIVTLINQENFKWNYGRQIRLNDSEKLQIKLPAKNNQPDWKFMEDYIKSLPYSKSL